MGDKQLPFREVTPSAVLTAAVALNGTGREGNNECEKKKGQCLRWNGCEQSEMHTSSSSWKTKMSQAEA